MSAPSDRKYEFRCGGIPSHRFTGNALKPCECGAKLMAWRPHKPDNDYRWTPIYNRFEVKAWTP